MNPTEANQGEGLGRDDGARPKVQNAESHNALALWGRDAADRWRSFPREDSLTTNNTAAITDQAEVDDQADQHHQQATERGHTSERGSSPATAEGFGGEKQQAQDGKHRVGNTGATEGVQDEAAVDEPHQHKNKVWACKPIAARRHITGRDAESSIAA